MYVLCGRCIRVYIVSLFAILHVHGGLGTSSVVCAGCSLFDIGSFPRQDAIRTGPPALSGASCAIPSNTSSHQHRTGVPGGEDRPGMNAVDPRTRTKIVLEGGAAQRKSYVPWCFPAFCTEANWGLHRSKDAFTRLARLNIVFLLAVYLAQSSLSENGVLWTVVKVLAVGATGAFAWAQYRRQWRAGNSIEVRLTIL